VSVLRGEPIPPSVFLSPSLGSEDKFADDEEEAEEEAEVRTLVETPHFQEVVGLGFTPPPEENEEPLPVAGNSTVPQLGIRYDLNAEHRAWILAMICAWQEANHHESEARGSNVARRRMVLELFDDPAETYDPWVDS
jgi:hypothetical protein